MPKKSKDSAGTKLTQPVLDPADVDLPKDRKGFVSLETILDLRKRGFSLSEVGKQLGVSKQAVSQMLRRNGCDVEQVEAYRRDKNIIFNAKQKILVDALTPKVVAKMSGRDLLVGVGILQDKIRDLENPAHGGITANLWISVVSQSQQAHAVDVTPKEAAE